MKAKVFVGLLVFALVMGFAVGCFAEPTHQVPVWQTQEFQQKMDKIVEEREARFAKDKKFWDSIYPSDEQIKAELNRRAELRKQEWAEAVEKGKKSGLTAEDWKAAGCNEAQTKLYMEGKEGMYRPNHPYFLRQCKPGWAAEIPQGFYSIPHATVPRSEPYRAPVTPGMYGTDSHGNSVYNTPGPGGTMLQIPVQPMIGNHNSHQYDTDGKLPGQ